MLACVPVLIAGLPLLSWAQASTPTPTASAAAATPSTLTTPAAAKDSAMKLAAPAAAKDTAMTLAAPPAEGGPKAVTLSDSARAEVVAQITRQLKEMADSLKLTTDQRAKARPILLDHGYQVKQLREKYATQERTPAITEEARKEMQVLRDATDTKLAQVLTADQMAQYKKKRDEELARARALMGMAAPAAAPALTPAAAPALTPAAVAPAAVAPAVVAPADTTKKKK